MIFSFRSLAVSAGLLFLVLLGVDNALLQHPNLTNELYVTALVPLLAALACYAAAHMRDRGICLSRGSLWPPSLLLRQQVGVWLRLSLRCVLLILAVLFNAWQ